MTWTLHEDDVFHILPQLGDDSVDLVILDPPYNIRKAGWDCIGTHEEYLEFIKDVMVECERILKDNGSLYLWHNQFKSLRDIDLMVEQNTSLVFKSLITVDKKDNNYIKDLYGSQNHFRNYLNLAEYLLFYTFQDETGLTTVKLDLNNFTSLREYFRDFQGALGLSLPQINKLLGHRRAEHAFYWKSTQWDLPMEDTYQQLCELPLHDNGFVRREYEDLRREYEDLRREYEDLRREYEDLRYTFNKKDGLKNIWAYHFREDQKTSHPTQKPISLCEDIIQYSSNPGDTVLIPFAGSGSEMIAGVNLNRNVVGIEREPSYCQLIRNRLQEVTSQQRLGVAVDV